MNWEQVAQEVIELNEWRRDNPNAPLSELDQKAAAITKDTPGWYLQWWRDHEEYVLKPLINLPEQV